ncbi:FAD-dependent oxidoreductase [Marinomonas sp. TI.3.20]|uniref:FAD-dependent oxidoreductase n=1 Tax=Marinomonas sp. TI.3.20 TaxID=3121296 RepID=UPI00311EDA45
MITFLTSIPKSVEEKFSSSKVSFFSGDLLNQHPEVIRRKLDEMNTKVIILSFEDRYILKNITTPSLPECVILFGLADFKLEDEIYALPQLSIVSGITLDLAVHQAFIEAERFIRPKPAKLAKIEINSKKSVSMVGAGIVNLVTALKLVQAGFSIEFFDRMPDPLLTTEFTLGISGATFGGMNARIFSFNESRQHLYRGLKSNSEPNQSFRARVRDGGWLCHDFTSLDPLEKSWIKRLEDMPSWLAGVYNEDIINYNRNSYNDWKGLFITYPKLLRGVNFLNNLLRIYQTQEAFQKAISTETSLGSCKEIITAERLTQLEPCFTDAVSTNEIVGALSVEGFSVNIISLSRNIIRLLKNLGVKFHWNSNFDGVEKNSSGKVVSLKFGSQKNTTDHVVLCPGAYARIGHGHLTPLDDIASVAGMWITLPNEVNPLTSPLKVRRKGYASAESSEGANIIPGHDCNGNPVIYCSSGHGFIGLSPDNFTKSGKDELFQSIKDTVQELFPDKYAEAIRKGMLNNPPEYCVRPWTSSGLGVFTSEEMESGGVLLQIGGHNTGGFAQAPAIAQAVYNVLIGQKDPMSEIYHSNRARTLA